MNNKIKTSFRTSIPWLLAGLGIVIIIVGELLNVSDSTKPVIVYAKDKVNAFLIEVGKAILVSGVASITLSSLKHLGIFSDELKKILFDTKFLRNRKDLPEYWERVTKELLSDKFPKINNLILSDVREVYLPTESLKYYENFWQHMNIKMLDKSSEMIEVTQTTKFLVIPNNKDIPDHQEFISNICHGGKSSGVTFNIVSASINKESINVNVDHQNIGNFLNSKFYLTLSGCDSYDVEIVIKKTYSLKNDCVMGYRHQNITHNSTLQFQLDGIKIDFIPIGTLKDYETKTQNDSLIVKEYVGLLYKNQGFVVHLRKK